jgi:hypothetical protein
MHSEQYLDRNAADQLAFFGKFFAPAMGVLKRVWRSSLQETLTDHTVQLQMKRRALELPSPDTTQVSLQDVGVIVAIMPVSESAVELSFSHSRYPFGIRSRQTSDALLDALDRAAAQ